MQLFQNERVSSTMVTNAYGACSSMAAEPGQPVEVLLRRRIEQPRRVDRLQSGRVEHFGRNRAQAHSYR